MVYLITVSFNIQVTTLNLCQSCCLLEVTQANEARNPSVGNNALTRGKLRVKLNEAADNSGNHADL